MISRLRVIGLFVIVGSLALLLHAGLAHPPAAQAGPGNQTGAPGGLVAFVGTGPDDTADIYLLDLTSSRVARLEAPVTSEASLAWQPDGDALAFTTTDGGYGLLRSLRGCFDPEAICTDIVYVIAPFEILDFAWQPDGEALFFSTTDGIKRAAPRVARPRDIQSLDLACRAGIDIAPGSGTGESLYLLCADSEDNADGADGANDTPVETSVYTLTTADPPEAELLYEIGTYPALTTFDLGPDGQAAVGTQESAGDSGFYAAPGTAATRLALYQVHVYDLAFNANGTQVAIIGAISDSTGDGSLRDGDTAELLMYAPANGDLEQIPGFTGAAALVWNPAQDHLLIVTEDREFSIYDVARDSTDSLAVTLPVPGLSVANPHWKPGAGADNGGLPIIPTATTGPKPLVTATRPAISTPIPTPTPFPTPFPTLTPFPTPFPTLTPFPTITPIPSATPGSPIGVGCQYALNPPPVTIGDTAVVTQAGAAVRFRTSPALDGGLIRELRTGTRMTILNGPFCSQGYRWWQAQLESDGRTGYLADSDLAAYWIETAAPPEPTTPAEMISFYASRYNITAGQCVTIVWSVEGIREVYYEGDGVTGSESRVECPTTTTTYTLEVIRLDGTTVTPTVTINVSPP